MKTKVLCGLLLSIVCLEVSAEVMTIQPAFLSYQNKGNAIEAYYNDSKDNMLLTFSPGLRKVISKGCFLNGRMVAPCKVKANVVWKRVAEPNYKKPEQFTIKGVITKVYGVGYAD